MSVVKSSLPQGAASPAEIRRLADELKEKTAVVVAWHERLGGAEINGRTVTLRLPGSTSIFRATSDAELAGLRAMELAGELVIHWPFRFRHVDEEHAPIAPAIEAVAQALVPRCVLSAA